jgi:hypothetical protein
VICRPGTSRTFFVDKAGVATVTPMKCQTVGEPGPAGRSASLESRASGIGMSNRGQASKECAREDFQGLPSGEQSSECNAYPSSSSGDAGSGHLGSWCSAAGCTLDEAVMQS